MTLTASPSAQALSALSTSLNATASNIANVSTEGYQPLRAELADGPGGQGVQVAAVSSAQGAEPQPARQGEIASVGPGAVNGVDLAREMVGLMQTERAFSANAVMVRAVEQTTGHVLDLIA